MSIGTASRRAVVVSSHMLICISRTETPVKVSHEFVLQVFFSVDGEDLAGNQLNDGDASGVMRMLVLPVPVMMPSVSRPISA